MKTPSVKALLAAFRDLTPADAGMIKGLARAVDHTEQLQLLLDSIPAKGEHTGGTDAACANRMWRRAYVLRAIDAILGTYGVEALTLESERDNYTSGPRFEYLNAGDTYATTLIYDSHADTLRIGCWGDIAERYDVV